MSVPTTVTSPTAMRLRDLWRLVTSNRKVSFGLAVMVFFVLVAIFGPLVIHQDPNAFSTDRLLPPSIAHWLGTTQTGQDILAQVIVGTRLSVFMGFAIGILTMVVSIIVGLISGYYI